MLNNASLWLRLGLSVAMIPHGYDQWAFPAGTQHVLFRSLGLTENTLWSLPICAVFFCSICLMAGFLTRYVLTTLIVSELIMICVAYQGNSMGDGSASFLLLFGYITSLLLGARDYSLDALLVKQ